jgi:isopentenyl diphosphate isomerase/L-lactate dehydrogenase-like FMN-dependent dehydrogenase
MLEALKKVNGKGILICKPRQDEGLLKERFQEAEKQNIFALGMDIDAFNFKTMILKNQQSGSKTLQDLSRIRRFTRLPFIIKGIMTVQDAELAIEAGADAIVVSNHGGRVIDGMPGTARVLPGIAEALKGRIPILVDGGIRNGLDVFRMLALGADQVLVGRPIAIAAVGGETAGVRFIINQYIQELIAAMYMTGSGSLNQISGKMLIKK